MKRQRRTIRCQFTLTGGDCCCGDGGPTNQVCRLPRTSLLDGRFFILVNLSSGSDVAQPKSLFVLAFVLCLWYQFGN